MDTNKEFYYFDGQTKIGPISFDDLKKKNIERSTLIWYNGLKDWVIAEELDFLQDVFRGPPPINNISGSTLENKQSNDKRNSKLKWWILVIVFLIFIISGITYFLFTRKTSSALPFKTNNVEINEGYSNKRYHNSTQSKENDDELALMELYEIERKQPTKYLSLKYDIDNKILSSKIKVKGTIYNDAIVAVFKDVVLKITYYSKTGSFLKEDYEVIYQYVYSTEPVNFKFNLSPPKQSKQINIQVVNALSE